jgi:hypothetical protein
VILKEVTLKPACLLPTKLDAGRVKLEKIFRQKITAFSSKTCKTASKITGLF